MTYIIMTAALPTKSIPKFKPATPKQTHVETKLQDKGRKPTPPTPTPDTSTKEELVRLLRIVVYF